MIPAGGRIFGRQDLPDILPDHVAHPEHPAYEGLWFRDRYSSQLKDNYFAEM